MNFIDVYQAKIYDGLTNNVLVIMGYVPLVHVITKVLTIQMQTKVKQVKPE